MTEVHPIEAHPIEAESYRIMRSRIDLSTLPPLTRAVTERIIHATADFDYVTDLVCDEAAQCRDPALADMHTLVVVGSSRTRIQAGRMVTPRDYRWSAP